MVAVSIIILLVKYGFVTAGIIANIFMIITTLRRKVILKWIKNHSAIDDLRLSVLLMPFLNLLYLFSNLGLQIKADIELYHGTSSLCIKEEVIKMVFSYLVLCGLFLIARSALQASCTENIKLNRSRILLELGLLLLSFILIVGLSVGYFESITLHQFESGNNYCITGIILPIAISILHFIVLVFVLISAIICHRRCKRVDINRLHISLSSAVGFLYSIFWFVQILFTILTIMIAVGNFGILVFPCLFCPIVCLKNKYQLFLNETEKSQVNTAEPVNLDDLKA